MKHILIISSALVLSAATAMAGPCSDRIAAIEKTLATADAGAGPTNSKSTTSSPSSETPRAGEVPGTGGTAGMNATVGNRATSPSDVRAQTSGAPTAAQGGGSTAQQISDAMATAKTADAAGDRLACGKALDETERLIKG